MHSPIKRLAYGFIGLLVATVAVAGMTGFAMPQNSYAASCGTNSSGYTDYYGGFLGFPTWYRDLCNAQDNSQLDLQTPGIRGDIFTIALNVLDILLRVVGILAVAYVVYGGFIFATARGEPDRAAKGRSAILQAVIGMVIAFVASAAVTFSNGKPEQNIMSY